MDTFGVLFADFISRLSDENLVELCALIDELKLIIDYEIIEGR